MCSEDGGDSLGLPPNTEKPLFVYGNLKPDELGYCLIPKQVSDPQPASVLGAWVSNTPSGVSCWMPDTRDDGVWLMISMMVGCSR
jgi:hypothetical protein